ncbi:hypothetical protein BDM02DRAFT_3118630 [Thelephora ganbajun]|uniref:Uncharacterized protein n=1 Tax=Thelephora ganbajun TaxID=370292 RepID=A0ACB6ZA91_THEGA|nr:hypothetical protein BDM02DRAFT_3118630 [Thelephora ganbajun]
MDYYHASLNELNTPNSSSVEELKIESFANRSLGTFTRFCTLRRCPVLRICERPGRYVGEGMTDPCVVWLLLHLDMPRSEVSSSLDTSSGMHR